MKVPTFDAMRQERDFGAFRDALARAEPGEAVLLQASCHNPTGDDFSLDEWRDLAELIADRDLMRIEQ